MQPLNFWTGNISKPVVRGDLMEFREQLEWEKNEGMNTKISLVAEISSGKSPDELYSWRVPWRVFYCIRFGCHERHEKFPHKNDEWKWKAGKHSWRSREEIKNVQVLPMDCQIPSRQFWKFIKNDLFV